MAVTEYYQPSPVESHLAQQGGIRYVAGVAILNAPDLTQDYHRLDVEQQPSEIVDLASKLILHGLTNVIRYAHHPELRVLEKMEFRYELALPNMMDTQEAVYLDQYEIGARANRHFPAIAALTPFPVLDESIYKRFCHGHFGSKKLPLTQMVEDVPIDFRLQQYC